MVSFENILSNYSTFRHKHANETIVVKYIPNIKHCRFMHNFHCTSIVFYLNSKLKSWKLHLSALADGKITGNLINFQSVFKSINQPTLLINDFNKLL